ncbi:MAG: hypothetical protein K8F29_07260 [Kofleriaceae bacterium]|nr:hypothetical protein [Candidatus Methylomirabilis lanthanidiphila]
MIRDGYACRPPPSEELRSQLGRLRLSEGNAQTEALLTGPAKGGGEGAARGAKMGVKFVLQGGDPFAFLFVPPAALMGTVVGAVRAMPAAEFDAKAQALRTAMEELKVPETFRRCVADRLQELTSTPGSRVMFEEPASTTLEVIVEQVGLTGAVEPINPPLSFVLTERTRLIRVSDGAELYGHWLTYRGRLRSLEEWFVQNSINSMLLREEADRACRELAERLVDEVFLLYRPGTE